MKLNPEKWGCPSGMNDTGINYNEYIDNKEIFFP